MQHTWVSVPSSPRLLAADESNPEQHTDQHYICHWEKAWEFQHQKYKSPAIEQEQHLLHCQLKPSKSCRQVPMLMNLSLAKNHTAIYDFNNTLGFDCICCLGFFLTTGVYFQTLPQQEGSEYVILCYFSNESWGSYVVILTPGAVFFKAHTKCQGTHNKISRIGKIAFAGFGEWAGCCWSHTLEGDTLTCSQPVNCAPRYNGNSPSTDIQQQEQDAQNSQAS